MLLVLKLFVKCTLTIFFLPALSSSRCLCTNETVVKTLDDITLFHDYNEWKTSRNTGTVVGLELSDNDARSCREFADSAESLLKVECLDRKSKHYLNVLLKEAETCLKGMAFKGFLLPEVTGINNFYRQQARVFSSVVPRSRTGLEKVLRAIENVPDYIRNVTALLQEGVKQNITFYEASVSPFIDSLKAIDPDPRKSPFYKPFKNLATRVTAVEKTFAKKRVLKVIKDEINPELSRLLRFLTTEYSQSTRKRPGIISLPDGAMRYKAILKFYNDIDLEPEEIHQSGIDGIVEMKSQVQKLAGSLGLNLTFSEFSEHAKNIAAPFNNSKELLNFILDKVHEIDLQLHQILPEDFLDEKHTNVNVKLLEHGSGLPVYYRRTPIGSDKPGLFIINAHNPNTFKRYELPTMILHEGNPGHNMENSFRSGLGDNLKFLKVVVGTLTSAPSLPPYYGSFTEGWALYSEFIGNEMGVFEDRPYDLFGYYGAQLLRYARLVADTGIHYFDWSRPKAIQFLQENTLLSQDRAAFEVDRYITWPGQATTYKIGEEVIRKLRMEREEKAGALFDAKKFHIDVMRCYGPLGLLNSCIELYDGLK